MGREPVASAVRATAAALREDILARPDGEWLGSEDDVLTRLGVSRPTLRQAARVLEAEELLLVKRGVNGGFFSRRPTSDAVAHMASLVLRSQETTVIDVARMWYLIAEQSARLAALHPDAARRGELVDLVAELRATTPSEDRTAAFEAARRFDDRVGDLARSPTLALFGRVLSTLVRETGLMAVHPQPGNHAWGRELEALADAISAGDGAKAARHVRRRGDVMMTSIAEQGLDRLVG